MDIIHINYGTSYEREAIAQKTIARARKAIKKMGNPHLLISTLSLYETIVNRDEMKVSMRQAAHTWLKKFVSKALGIDEKSAGVFIKNNYI